MSVSAHAVLVAVVEQYDGEPLTREAIARRTGADDAAVDECLATLVDTELLAATESGYRPTVTGREFLALDVDLQDIVALEVVEE